MKSGIVVINKERGYTSQDVVSKVKKILNIKKAGHAGTLDPLATGVLPVLIGSATKLSKYLIEHDKTYIATLKLGEKRNTGDEEGEIIQIAKVGNLEEKTIKSALNEMKGRQSQAPHKYSAVKINGKKLYEYAREKKDVEIPSRDINIYDIKLLNINNEEKEIKFEVFCSKGTYIRVLCENIAEKLETCGYMKTLQRTKVDKFTLQDAVKLSMLTEKNIITPEKICSTQYEKIYLSAKKINFFLNGVQLTMNIEDGLYMVYNDKEFIGLGIIKNNLLKRDIVFKENEKYIR